MLFYDDSENAAGNLALNESCKLNNIDSQDYLKHLFENIPYSKDCYKKTLLPCFYKSEF
ncbi:transposase domain-containing protein [uncultured Bacteroides sp.]|uniref:transposase domain-containing protein n=1 Tax=uncultured Bacteroides sp. TaxID=162156 RepID=UPI0027D978BA|nr:transposase domain-containing protein [uncultured Bacteroides sp.]